MTCGFLIQLKFCKKKTMWCIGVEAEQETSAPPPKKNPGFAPVKWRRRHSSRVQRHGTFLTNHTSIDGNCICEAGWLHKVFGTQVFPFVFPRITFFLVGYSKWGWLASPFTLPGSAPASSSDHSDTAGDIHVVAQPVKITFKPLGLGRRTNMTKGRVMISLVLLLKHFGILE